MNLLIVGLTALTSTAGGTATSTVEGTTGLEAMMRTPSSGDRPSSTVVRARTEPTLASSIGLYSRISSVVPSDDSIASVSPIGALVRFEFGVSYALAPDRGLSLGLGLATGAQTRRIFDAGSALLGLTSLQIGASYRVPVLSFFGAYARATGSVDWGHLTIREMSGVTELDDVAVAFTGAAVVGADVAFPLGYTTVDSGEVADQWMSFYFELGYAVASDLDFNDLRRDVGDTEPASINRASLDAGAIDMSGVTWRLGLAFRF